MTCRCPMCGRKRAGKLGKRSYWRVGIKCDEDGLSSNYSTKKQSRKIRRTREKRMFNV